jgi:hypothetical protein
MIRRRHRDSIGPDEEVVRSDELAQLRKIRTAHDDYLAALTEMHRRRSHMEAGGVGTGSEDYRRGWLDALREHGAAVLEAMRSRR